MTAVPDSGLPDPGLPGAHENEAPTVVAAREGAAEIAPLPGGRFRVTLKPRDPELFIPRASCDTSLPPDVIEAFLQASFPRLCDSLARHDDPDYVIKVLEKQVFAYVDPADFRGKRLLDFGCGTGASTLAIAAMLPETEVTGVELSAGHIDLARRVLAARQRANADSSGARQDRNGTAASLNNVRFLASPDPNSLPEGIGTFDYAMLSAVYEHLLPGERRRVMPLIWSHLKEGGLLFINQTPYRYFPYEHHSTGLWLINYVPDPLAHSLARRLSRVNPEINKSQDWNAHLRGGIRGGTEGEILRNLRLAENGRPSVIQPRTTDRAAYWLSCTNSERHRFLKKTIASMFRITDKLWGTVPSINVDVVIRKDPGE